MARILYDDAARGISSYSVGQMVVNHHAFPEDGWVTRIAVAAAALHSGFPSLYRLVLYVGNDRAFLSETATMGTTFNYRTADINARRVSRNSTVRWGMSVGDNAWSVKLGATNGVTLHNHGENTLDAYPPPVAYPGGYQTQSSTNLQSYLDYTPNATPSKGTWRASAPTGIISTTSPLFEGNTPHPSSESGLDYTSEVHLQVWRTDTGAMAYDTLFATTQTEKNQGYFSRSPVTLAAGTTYRAKFRHRDSWGVYSAWSDDIEFTTSEIPHPPDPTEPLGKINAVDGFAYRMIYEHPNGLNCTAKQVQVWNAEGTTKLHDSGELSEPDSPPGTNISAQNQFVQSAPLSWATAYKWRARVKDTAENWSQYCAFADFNTNAPPDPPTDLNPTDNIATQERTFTASVSDPDGDPVTAAEIELVNADTNAVVTGYPQQMTIDSQTNTATFTAPEADLTLNTNYKWRARADDGNGAGYGLWSGYAFFRYAEVPAVTMLVPKAPRTNLVRQPSAEYDPATLTAYWTETARAETGKNLLTYNQSSAEDGDTTGYTAVIATLTASSADVYSGSYSFRAECTTDGTYGAYISTPRPDIPANQDVAAQAAFKAPAGKTILMQIHQRDAANTTTLQTTNFTASATGDWQTVSGVASALAEDTKIFITCYTQGGVVGDVTYFDNVQVEEGSTVTTWEIGSQGNADYINRMVDGDAAFGVAAWEGVASATGDNRFQMPLEAVDATQPYFAATEMRKKSGTSAAHFVVLCYDGTGTLLGTVYPSSIAAANGADVPDSWTRYGGIVWPAGSANTPAFPAGTTQARLEWTPSRNSESTVRADAFQFEEVSLLSDTDWALAQKWFGFGEVSGEFPDNVWLGDEGDSAQSVLPTLLEPSASVFISYSSASGLTKLDDRLFIEEWQVDRWKQILDTGFPPPAAASDRTRIPVPSGYLKNGGRYRIKVQARDTAEVVGETAWHRLDVRLDGPPELGIILSEADPVKAELRVQFNPTTLTAEEFGGIEVGRESSDGTEPLEIVEVIRDPAATEAVYPYPVSGREYRLRVRQVKVVGSEQIEGRWSTAILSVDYWPYFFVKDTDDPTLYAAYEAEGSRIPPEEEDAPSQVFTPWGAEKPTILTREALRLRGGEVVAEFYPDALQQEDHDERYEKTRQIAERRRTICVLRQVPDGGKTFASIQGTVRKGFTPPRTKTIEFAYAENNFSEDYREREGI